MAQDRPCAVVESPTFVEIYGDGSEQLLNAAGEGGVAWSGILDFEKLARESAEIVNRTRGSRDGDAGSGQIPMGRDAKDRFRFFQRCADGGPGFRIRIARER